MFKLYFSTHNLLLRQMTTFVLNTHFGGFQLSDEALKRLGWGRDSAFLGLDIESRSNPELVRVCKELGRRASSDGKAFDLVVVDRSDAPFVKFHEYDGAESIEIDTAAKECAAQTKCITAVRAVLACTTLSDSEKLTLITTIFK